MPLSAILIRLAPNATPDAVAKELITLPHVELGASTPHAIAGVVDADSYAEHDATITALGQASGVCTVEIVLHDFSDVTQFDRLPKKRRVER